MNICMASAQNKYELIEAFVNEIDPDIQVFFKDDVFFAISECGIINVAFYPFSEADRLFNEFIKENFNTEVDAFLISILHEVGHIMTYSEELDDQRAFLYSLLQMDYDDSKWEEYTKMYFEIPAEFEATQWGVEFYLSHKKLCDEFVTKMGTM